MLSLLSRIIKKIANLLIFFANKISPPPVIQPQTPSRQSIRVIPWFKDNGDKTHRLNYDLSKDSVVFDLGGYEGQWASDIFSKYVCTVHIFEPYRVYAAKIQERFKKNDNVFVHSFGLAMNADSLMMTVSADSSSLFKDGDDATEVQMVEASDFFDKHHVETVDLMKINIEGGEYDLLDYLIEKHLVNRIENIQVQFHDFVDNAEERMHAIQAKLNDTHYLTYQYEFVWENWARKK